MTLGAALSACGFGIGAGVRYHPVTVTDGKGLSADVTGGEWSKGMLSPEITIYDRTGLMLAGLVTAANRYNAAQDALASARARGVPAGSSVPYTYEVMPALPGMFTRLTFSWGSSDDIESKTGRSLRTDFSYFSFDLRTRMLTWPLGDTANLLSFDIGVNWTSYDGDDAEAKRQIYGLSFDYIGMPLGLAHSLGLGDRFVLSERVMIDPVMWLVGAIVGDGGLPWEVGVRLDAAVVPEIFDGGDLFAFADVQFRHLPEIGEDRYASEWTATFGIGLVTDIASP
ncbi:MAG: hypothetical protein H6745_25805 [Deltaproteobacteria bacterium]|nr:hypothetical protein [Deltaproteobacteria bacterium]